MFTVEIIGAGKEHNVNNPMIVKGTVGSFVFKNWTRVDLIKLQISLYVLRRGNKCYLSKVFW